MYFYIYTIISENSGGIDGTDLIENGLEEEQFTVIQNMET